MARCWTSAASPALGPPPKRGKPPRRNPAPEAVWPAAVQIISHRSLAATAPTTCHCIAQRLELLRPETRAARLHTDARCPFRHVVTCPSRMARSACPKVPQRLAHVAAAWMLALLMAGRRQRSQASTDSADASPVRMSDTCAYNSEAARTACRHLRHTRGNVCCLRGSIKRVSGPSARWGRRHVCQTAQGSHLPQSNAALTVSSRLSRASRNGARRSSTV